MYYISSVLVLLACLYIPGFLFIRSVGIRKFAFLYAPLVSVGLYCIIAELFNRINVFANPLRLILSVFAIIGIAWGIRWLYFKIAKKENIFCFKFSNINQYLRQFVLYLCLSRVQILFMALFCVAGAICFFVYCFLQLADIQHLNITIDTVTHIAGAKEMIETGVWSSFNKEGGFYPKAIYLLAALISSIMGIDVTAGYNVFFCAATVALYPLGVFALLKKFKSNNLILLCGSFVIAASSVYPVFTYVRYGIWPYSSAVMLTGYIICAFIDLLAAAKTRKNIIPYFVLFVCIIFCFAFMHTSVMLYSTFSLLPILIYYCFGYGKIFWRNILYALLAVIVFCIFWYICYKLPIFQGPINYPRGDNLETYEKNFKDIFWMNYLWSDKKITQGFLSFTGIIGVIYCVLKRKYIYFSLIYVFWIVYYIIIDTVNGPLRVVMAGFVYRDNRRILIFVMYFAVIAAVFGVYALGKLLVKAAIKFDIIRKSSEYGKHALSCAICASFVFCVFGGDLSNGVLNLHVNSLVQSQKYASARLSGENYFFDNDEIAFGKKVKSIVGDDLVLNIPSDGSALLYAYADLNVYCRSLHCQTTDINELVESLYKYKTEPLVYTKAKEINAKWLILLDAGYYYSDTPAGELNGHLYLNSYYGFAGYVEVCNSYSSFEPLLNQINQNNEYISTLTDSSDIAYYESLNLKLESQLELLRHEGCQNNPDGFELVLEEDDMRLYRITY